MVGIVYKLNNNEKIMIFNKGIYITTYNIVEYDTYKLNYIYTLKDVNNITFGKLDGKNIEENLEKAIIEIVKKGNLGNKY